MEPPKTSLGAIEDVPSSVLLTFKSSDIDKLAQVFSAINNNYSANEIRQEFSDFQGSPQVNESVADFPRQEIVDAAVDRFIRVFKVPENIDEYDIDQYLRKILTSSGYEDNYWTDADEMTQEIKSRLEVELSESLEESVADPREYDLEDLGMTSEEADRARQEADDELTRLMDRMGVDANDAANHSRWNRVVDDIAYLVASCRRYDIEPYKYND